MHLELMRDKGKSFPVLDADRIVEINTLRVWHCKYKTLQPLAELTNLEELMIATFPDQSLELLAPLLKLRYLSILHLPKVSELDALSNLSNLQALSLATLPSWDASRKCTTVQSLQPLVAIKSLRHLELFGVRPPDKSLAVLEQCRNLETGRFSQYPQAEIDRFYRVTGIKNQFNPKPSFLSA